MQRQWILRRFKTATLCGLHVDQKREAGPALSSWLRFIDADNDVIAIERTTDYWQVTCLNVARCKVILELCRLNSLHHQACKRLAIVSVSTNNVPLWSTNTDKVLRNKGITTRLDSSSDPHTRSPSTLPHQTTSTKTKTKRHRHVSLAMPIPPLDRLPPSVAHRLHRSASPPAAHQLQHHHPPSKPSARPTSARCMPITSTRLCP